MCDDFYKANVWLCALASFVFNIFPHIYRIECVSDHIACVNSHVDDWKLATSHSIPKLLPGTYQAFCFQASIKVRVYLVSK